MIPRVWIRDSYMKLFTEHPRSVGESYFQHMAAAAAFAGRMLTGALCCLLHALLPFLFERKASGIIAELYDHMVANRAGGPRSPNNISVRGTDERRRVTTGVSADQGRQGTH